MAEPLAYEDFAKLDLRVAKVLEARPHPNADKLRIAVQFYVDHGRKVAGGGRRSSSESGSGRRGYGTTRDAAQTKAIRDWAKENGLKSVMLPS